MKLRLVFTLILATLCATANAADPAIDIVETQNVNVTAVKDPLFKSYRSVWAGLDAFDKYHHFAPNAVLKFSLNRYADVNKFASNWQGAALRIAGDDSRPSIPIPIASDGTFVVPRVQSAYDDDAEIIGNQKEAFVGGIPDIRTPGLPPNTRRLGDLRLECEVVQAIAKKDTKIPARAVVTIVTLGSNLCMVKSLDIGRTAPDRMVSATLVVGNTRKDVRFSGTKFFPPIQDKSIPDDALIEFVYWSQASVDAKQAYFSRFPMFFKGSLDKWGSDVPLRANGATHYTAKVTLRARDYAFKLIDKDKRIEYGTPGPTSMSMSANPLVVGMWWRGYDFIFRCTQPGDYVFTVDVQNPDQPMLSISRVE